MFKKIDSRVLVALSALAFVVLAGCGGGKDFPDPVWKGGPTGGAPDPGIVNTASRGLGSILRLLTDGMFTFGWLFGFAVILLLDWIVIGAIPGLLAGDAESRVEAKTIIPLAGLILIPALVFRSWGLVIGVVMCNIIPALVQYFRDEEEGKFAVYGIPCYAFFLFYYYHGWKWIEEHPLGFVGLTVVGIVFVVLFFRDKKEAEAH